MDIYNIYIYGNNLFNTCIVNCLVHRLMQLDICYFMWGPMLL